ncbi:retrovirus-related pol polyprotein from transposon TNT 1-94 [Tanacetum coccineum]
MSKATSTKSWLWHRGLSHLNFSTINDLTRLDLVDGLPKFKYGKDHLYSACERGKRKKASHPPKLIPSDHSKLELLHMDLYGPIRVVQIVLWIVDSGCSKHMTGDRSLLKNFIEKFMGTIRFGNDNFAAITTILSHLNFGTINDLTRLDLVDGLPKFKYGKDHLCSACERGKSKKASHPLKLVPSEALQINASYGVYAVQCG